ncbi:hypothetical protein QAD02_017265 [Eretmocerus hayati]|uniref:Uncharacterized protein n=1 Tax=Eretmocerus hayati TaxID=131215 RepID=A0ACC2PEI6_9HYME|nr:hypothetical protein QAD02_017265 [Eretmocerus hayati]
MDSAIMTLRNKFAEDIEEILQCPVCCENLSGPVAMCTQGHHVCVKCQMQISECPYCKNPFNGTRNFLAETLATKLDEIKLSLTDPKYKSRGATIDGIGAQTQTDVVANLHSCDNFLNNKISNANLSNLKVAPSVGKGTYPCKLGNCTEELAHGRMIPHIRYYHKETYTQEKISDKTCYTASWIIPYDLPSCFQRAISIPNMGVFFLTITITADGDLHGNMQIVNTAQVAKQFSYQLNVGNSSNITSFKGLVIGCRTAETKLSQKCLFVNSSYMHYLLRKGRNFSCELILHRMFEEF